ncbi:MAG: hypothetical protein J7K22_03030 [Nanoarchaeota archaeon]|nr:hypothetical protein [Nanoarchaeota archaeon]
MVEDILKKYGKIISKNSFYELELKRDFEELKEELTRKGYEVNLISRKGNKVKLKISKDLFKRFLNVLKKYKEGVPPEDIRFLEEE